MNQLTKVFEGNEVASLERGATNVRFSGCM